MVPRVFIRTNDPRPFKAMKNELKKVSNMHEAISDYLIANPHHKARQCAAQFGVTEMWLSCIKNSDAFKEFHRKRREAHFEKVSDYALESVTGTVTDKAQAISEMCLDEIGERLETEREDLSLAQLQDIGKMTLGALGFGQKNAVQVNVNKSDNRSITINDAEALARSRERLALTRQHNDEAILQSRVEETTSKEKVQQA